MVKKSERHAPEQAFSSGYFALFPTMFWEPVKISEDICLIEHPLLVLIKISLVLFLIGTRWKFWVGSCMHFSINAESWAWQSLSLHPSYCRCSSIGRVWHSTGGAARPSWIKLCRLGLSFAFHLKVLKHIKAIWVPFCSSLFKPAEVFCWKQLTIACGG